MTRPWTYLAWAASNVGCRVIAVEVPAMGMAYAPGESVLMAVQPVLRGRVAESRRGQPLVVLLRVADVLRWERWDAERIAEEVQCGRG